MRLRDVLRSLKEESSGLKTRWQKEKEEIAKIRAAKEKIEDAKLKASQAERAGDLGKAAELKYGVLVQLQKELEQGQKRLAEFQKGKGMLKEEVDSEDIAEVVYKWTGIPVMKMMEGEKDKLLKMEDRLKK